MSDNENFKIIDGKKVPVYKAKVVETFKNKRTGKVYDNKADVADTTPDTTVDDLQQDVAIEVASLQVFGKTK